MYSKNVALTKNQIQMLEDIANKNFKGNFSRALREELRKSSNSEPMVTVTGYDLK